MNKYVTNLTLPNGTNLLIKDSECRTNLSNEIERATKKETWLQTNIETVESAREDGDNRLHQIIINETNRATKKETALQNSIDAINNAQHPIGSIYMSMNSNSPASLFGGTWEQLKDRFLLSAGDTYMAGSTGGEASHVLTVDEMPAHNHALLKGQGTDDNPGGKAQAKPDRSFGYADAKYDNKFYWQSYTFYTGGDSVSHNNMPPYLAVYVWKRIA